LMTRRSRPVHNGRRTRTVCPVLAVSSANARPHDQQPRPCGWPSTVEGGKIQTGGSASVCRRMKLRSVVVPYVHADGMSAQGMPMPVRRMEGGPADRGRMDPRFRLWMRTGTPGVLSKYCTGLQLRQGYLLCLGRYGESCIRYPAQLDERSVRRLQRGHAGRHPVPSGGSGALLSSWIPDSSLQ
jgi:hypothetical protein